MNALFADMLGFGACKMIRRILGFAHVLDLDGIRDERMRADCEASALSLARALLIGARRVRLDRRCCSTRCGAWPCDAPDPCTVSRPPAAWCVLHMDAAPRHGICYTAMHGSVLSLFPRPVHPCSSMQSARLSRIRATRRRSAWMRSRNPRGSPELDARTHYVAESVLRSDNGIEARLARARLPCRGIRNRSRYLGAPFCSTRAEARRASGASGAGDGGTCTEAIDAVVVSTCTGYLCPGLSGYVVEALDLRADIQAFDLVGQGCAAAVPNLSLGRALLESGASEHVLSVCVEVSSAAMYLDDDPGVIVSACLFGDGAGAAVLSRRPLRRVLERSSGGTAPRLSIRRAEKRSGSSSAAACCAIF